MSWLTFLVLVIAIAGVSADFSSCSTVRSEYNRQGFFDTVPKRPFTGTTLKYCRGDGDKPPKTCCTKVMEHMLAVQSRLDFDTSLKKLLNPFANLLQQKHKKFDELFVNLLNHSRNSFDELFRKTYGILYEQNSAIFMDLFQSLEDYYNKGEPDMAAQMRNFFQRLNEKMFMVFNSQYVFNKQYLKCVNRHMEDLQSFGDIPPKLTTNVKRSFVAFRTFVQGLSTAASVVSSVTKINPGINCLHELMKITHCSTCAGHQGVLPCLPYCLHVQELCLAHHLPLAEGWSKFIDAMEKLGTRLEGPFNVGNEAQPINYKISTAIMNFQESGNEISKKIFELCGEPRLGRYARSAKGELEFESLKFNGNRRTPDAESYAGKNGQFSRLIREIKTKLKNSENFWSELPSGMCKEARHHGAAECWTGTGLGKYNGTSLMKLHSSPTNSDMDEQLFKLRLITKKLNEAYLGRDVSWIDEEWLGVKSKNLQEDESYEGSGTHPHPKRPQYPPDDEDGYTESENEEGSGDEHGSGMSPVHYPDHPFKGGNHEVPLDVYNFPPPRENLPPRAGNPSASPTDKSMTLVWAIAVYFVPAIFSFLSSIG